MSLRQANFKYLFIMIVWSALTFTVLLPDAKHILYTTCVWRLNFQVCDKFVDIEGAYRFTSSLCLFFIVLGLLTTNCNKTYAKWLHNECWLIKLPVFIAVNLVSFLVPFSALLMASLYYIMLCGAILFLTFACFVSLDLVHAWRLVWMRKANEKANTPTCYMCTWLFLIHLATSFLYAISVDFIMAIFFFNNISDCKSTIIFLCINVVVCFVAFSISYFPALKDRQASSQIVFSMLLAQVVFSTWLAISDPENEDCNMFGTVFTGSILDSSVSFKSLACLVYALPVILFVSADAELPSYTRSLVTDSKSSENSWFRYSRVHFMYALASCFVLMSVTNFYEPVYFTFQSASKFGKQLRTAVIYFEGYNKPRFILLCSVSGSVGVIYVTLLITRLSKDYFNIRKEREIAAEDGGDTFRVHSLSSDKTDEFVYIEISKGHALKKLKASSEKFHSPAPQDLHYLLVQCFYIRDCRLSFWHFPSYISQTFFGGRNGSNACTIIAALFGRFFARSEIPSQSHGYLSDTWIKLFTSSIEEGNRLYDFVVRELGVLDLSIEEVAERLGKQLNIQKVWPSLPVSFQSDVESATIYYQLLALTQRHQKQVVTFTHKQRTSVFLIYEDGTVKFLDSHAFGEGGSILVACNTNGLEDMVCFLRDLLDNNENKLATLTLVEYEKRAITKGSQQ